MEEEIEILMDMLKDANERINTLEDLLTENDIEIPGGNT